MTSAHSDIIAGSFREGNPGIVLKLQGREGEEGKRRKGGGVTEVWAESDRRGGK